jgi:hypothetical protein
VWILQPVARLALMKLNALNNRSSTDTGSMEIASLPTA